MGSVVGGVWGKDGGWSQMSLAGYCTFCHSAPNGRDFCSSWAQKGLFPPSPSPAEFRATCASACLIATHLQRPLTNRSHHKVIACQGPASGLTNALPPQFLRDTLAVVSDNIWICQLSQEMCKQLPSYSGTPQEKVPETS